MSRGRGNDRPSLSCSFCGKSQKEVRKLIAGPTVYICDECISLCNDIIAEELGAQDQASGSKELPKPAEIYETLGEYVIGQEYAKRVLEFAGLAEKEARRRYAS